MLVYNQRLMTERITRLVLLVCLALLPGCIQQVRRSALVPAVVPPMATGRPVDNGTAGLTLGNATFLAKATPADLNGASNAGLYIPRTQFGLQALFRVGQDIGLGFKVELGLAEDAQPIADDIPPPPTSPVFGIGPMFRYSIPVHPHFRIGLGIETLLTFVPYEKYTSTPALGWQHNESGVDATWLVGLHLVPCFVWDPVTIFAGIAGRNQPTNTKEEVTVTGQDLFEDEVRFGPMYLVTFAGLQVRLFKRLDLVAELYYPVNRDPVAYGGPALAIWLTVGLGDPPRPRRRPAPVQAPAPAPAPRQDPSQVPPPATPAPPLP